MCINPSYVWVSRGPKWEKQPVPCRACWRCKNNRLNDYVARSLAEAVTSTHVCAITLTYAPRDDLADRIIHKSHFQKFVRALRKGGHEVRYLVVGEYGELKGRAHFHAILFFTKLLPGRDGDQPGYNARHVEDPASSAPFSAKIPQKKRIHVREWPHGHVLVDWTRCENAIRYVCKYLLSDEKDRSWFSVSKKPPLGARWFAERAALARFHGVLPSSFTYSPPGGRSDRTYPMTGATRRDYLNAITTDPADRARMSEWCLKSFDRYGRERAIKELAELPAEVQAEAWADSMAERERRTSEARSWALYREVNFNDELIRASCDGIGRKPKE